MKTRHGTILSGALLIAGTTIGGGMLALPVLTSQGGFIPSMVIYFICWLFMSLTGLLFLELALRMEPGVNIVTMAERTLGLGGKIAAWSLYLFLFYCLTVAYVVGSGDIINNFSRNAFPRWLGGPIFLLFAAPLVYAGSKVVGKLNYFFMSALFFFFFAFVFIGSPNIEMANLTTSNWSLSLLALPIAFVAFAYQGIIPTLITYLDNDPRKVRWSIWLGTLITLVVYIIWQWLILGIVPFEGPGGLKEALNEGRNAVYPLKNHLDSSKVFFIAEGFAFFALITSFFGVTLGLVDFLSDGLKIEKTPLGKLFLIGLIFIPSLTIAMFHPDIFLSALDLAGGYGTSLLLGLLPVLMVAKLRKDDPHEFHQVGGGNLVLILLACFVFFEVMIAFMFEP